MNNTLALILSILVSAIALLLGAMGYIYLRNDTEAWKGIKNAIGSAFSALFGLTMGQAKDNWLLDKLAKLFDTAQKTNLAPLLVIWLLLLILFALLGVALGWLLVTMGVVKAAVATSIAPKGIAPERREVAAPGGLPKIYKNFFTWLGRY